MLRSHLFAVVLVIPVPISNVHLSSWLKILSGLLISWLVLKGIEPRMELAADCDGRGCSHLCRWVLGCCG